MRLTLLAAFLALISTAALTELAASAPARRGSRADARSVFFAAIGHLNEEEMATQSNQRTDSTVPASGVATTSVKTAATPAAQPSASGRTPAMNATVCSTTGGTQTCIKYTHGVVTRVCAYGRGRVTCTYYNPSGKAYKRCTAKNGRTTCVRFPSAAEDAAAFSIRWQGWPSKTLSTVGKLGLVYPDGASGTCTGTVVARALVLTAAHCLWDPQHGGYASDVAFAPGTTWRTLSSNDPKDVVTPEGVWGASRWWVPDAYRARGAFGADYGLIEIPPASGGYLSDYTDGAWTVTWNIHYGADSHIYIAGYPAHGYWATSSGGVGRGLYACDASIDGDYQNEDSGYALFAPCSLNQGSSGGPWFVQLSNGSWTVGAVTSRCYAKPCEPWSQHMLGTYFDSSFGSFWSDVWAQLKWH